MTLDETTTAIKAAFARDPLPLLRALGLRVDDHKGHNKGGREVWAYDGTEQDASLLIGGKAGHEGHCTRFGGDWSGDCFALVKRYNPTFDFPRQREYVAQAYGIRLEASERSGDRKPKVIAKHEYPVSIDGTVVAVHVRHDYADGGKRMWWADPQGAAGLPEGLDIAALPLWRSEDLAAHPTRPVIVCEGERDTDALHAVNLLAVGTYGADVLPSEAVLAPLVGRKVFLWPDNDDHGRRHMRKLAQRLSDMGWQCGVLEWTDAPDKGGAADWFAAGKTVEELRALARKARPWQAALPPENDAETAEVCAAAVNALDTYTAPDGIRKGAQPLREVASEIIEAVEARRLLPAGIYGLRSGWPTVDRHFGGFKFQGLILLLGGSGIGKTTLARHFLFATVEHILEVQSDAKILFYALEGGLEQFFWYYGAYAHEIPMRCFEPGGVNYMTEDIDRRMADAYVAFPTLPIIISEETDGDAIIFDIERQVAEREIEAVILDNVQELTYSSGMRYSNNDRMASAVRDFCKSTGIPFLALSQVNEFKGQKQSPRGGPEWFQKAGCVLTAKRGEPGASRDEALATNLTRISCQKQRYAPHGIMPEQRLVMDLKTQRLYEDASVLGDQSMSRVPEEGWPGND